MLLRDLGVQDSRYCAVASERSADGVRKVTEVREVLPGRQHRRQLRRQPQVSKHSNRSHLHYLHQHLRSVTLLHGSLLRPQHLLPGHLSLKLYLMVLMTEMTIVSQKPKQKQMRRVMMMQRPSSMQANPK